MAALPRSQAPSKPPVITLLTDFGLADVYVGVMKGVITSICPGAPVIDLTHQISPQNIAMGSFQLGNAYAHFPQNTIHVGVVDPGVGSDRQAVAVQTQSCTLVGPNNGLFSHILMKEEAILTVELTNSQYWSLDRPSNTFHGRDIFAPVAAYLAKGIPLQNLGTILPSSILITLPDIDFWQPTQQGGVGKIQAIDYFGNLITNIPAIRVQNHSWHLVVDQHPIHSSTAYHSSEENPDVQALVGSHGWLEIALPNGNAHQALNMNIGDRVELQLHGQSID
ncbi:SAM-dependent chlorinase/fluorinase [Acaryochloris sp. IP29b_bin.137]|uniref:SAM hydrolase/SAM-dependent halogenase family protein n=1 Tax=Acaryochloris sp. IP29b_bin.137 TaxID=2969217 RepID=UPI00261A5F8B|nr:SAM-dependent chlorinase/fluorinase [Acaryochloris sp. IP29b_bin.137]